MALYSDWLRIVLDSKRTIGIKLDFKDPRAVPECLAELQRCTVDEHGRLHPLWLNADILRGPGGGESPFDAHHFVQTCYEAFPRSVLSIGWTTGPFGPRRYLPEHIDAMARVLADFPHVACTFPVRAEFIVPSVSELQRLLALSPDKAYSLTAWGSVSAADCALVARLVPRTHFDVALDERHWLWRIL